VQKCRNIFFLSHTHTNTLSLTLTLSLSRTQIHRHPHMHTYILCTLSLTLTLTLTFSLNTSITVLGDVPHVALKGVAAGAISATLGCVQTGQSIDTVVCISIPKGMCLLDSLYYQSMREAIILNLTVRDF
jgi:hypothetical protein